MTYIILCFKFNIKTLIFKFIIPAAPNLFGTGDQFRGRQFFHGRGVGGWGDGSGGNASDGERWGAMGSGGR